MTSTAQLQPHPLYDVHCPVSDSSSLKRPLPSLILSMTSTAQLQPLYDSQVSPENSRQLQRTPDSSRQLQTVPDSSRQLQTVPDSSRQLQTAPDSSRQFQTVPDSSRQFQTVPDSSRQLQTAPDSSRQFQTAPDSSRQFQTVPDSSRHYISPNCFYGGVAVQSMGSSKLALLMVLMACVEHAWSASCVVDSFTVKEDFEPKRDNISAEYTIDDDGTMTALLQGTSIQRIVRGKQEEICMAGQFEPVLQSGAC
ncbi:unnamed protein product [Coregonus sp. 'balchen']|nr:unnamed protein product [Coregonus sp. 'balchen']